MTHDQDIETLIVAAHTLTRLAALETANDTPAAQWRTLTILRDHGPLRVGAGDTEQQGEGGRESASMHHAV